MKFESCGAPDQSPVRAWQGGRSGRSGGLSWLNGGRDGDQHDGAAVNLCGPWCRPRPWLLREMIFAVVAVIEVKVVKRY
jgi:hypothetical protein